MTQYDPVTHPALGRNFEHAAAEVTARPIDGLAKCQVEARFVGDVPAVQLVRVSGLSVLVPESTSPLPDEIGPGPTLTGVEPGPGTRGVRRADKQALPDGTGVSGYGFGVSVEFQIDQVRAA